ncbi:MAG: hypothetical protein H6Q20_1974 [Bacteroidetes bacterium]|nr:hypothetical protein [Bacteroidota bacterium]
MPVAKAIYINKCSFCRFSNSLVSTNPAKFLKIIIALTKKHYFFECSPKNKPLQIFW